jgi:multidrug resistance efflux pump
MRLSQLAIGAGILAAGGAAAARAAWVELASGAMNVPTAAVTRGDVTTDVHASGEVRAPTTMILTTPAVGGQMRILTIKHTGAIVNAGDVVVALDPAEQVYRLDSQRSSLAEAEAEISQANADAAAQQARDSVNLVIAQAKLQKAELDVAGNELLGGIEARKRVLTLEEARRRLVQLQEDITFHVKLNEASMASAVQKRDKARLLFENAQTTIAQMTLRAPLAGVVSVQSNQEGTYSIGGAPIPEYREGDTISSGRTVAEILDVARLEIVARVSETDVALLRQGQRALLTLNANATDSANPNRPIDGIVTSIGDVRSPGFSDTPSPVRKVDVVLQFLTPVASARPGMTVRVVMKGYPLRDVLSVPRQAVFDRGGQFYVFVKTGDRFALTPVKIAARTETVVVVRDLAEATVVALADPGVSTHQSRQRTALHH